jgi:DNA-binding response OmpR family regulator
LDIAPQVVLLVEGDIAVRHPLAEYLRACGFTVFEATTGVEAKEALSAAEIRIDIVLADMGTVACGFGLRQWIKDHSKAEVILAGSMNNVVLHAGEICNEGPALTKPYEHRLVLDHIRRALARRNRN